MDTLKEACRIVCLRYKQCVRCPFRQLWEVCTVVSVATGTNNKKARLEAAKMLNYYVREGFDDDKDNELIKKAVKDYFRYEGELN